ncbi:MAG: nuclease (SNase) [Sideroxydans sp.]|nr:nuclease (SNase) [Sideroxydans sp.]
MLYVPVLLLSLCGTASAEQFLAKVVAVLDGDTVLVVRNQHPLKIRLADIDAPEKAQDYGMASRDALVRMVLHQQVRVDTLALDKYGRTVALLEVDGMSVNEEMVRRGLAWEYSHFHSDRHYIALQAAAQQAKRGLWRQANPMPPWQWRKQHTDERDVPPVLAAGDYSCGSKHHCSQMRSCNEAHYYLTVCGVKALNPEGDGVPCRKLCLHR